MGLPEGNWGFRLLGDGYFTDRGDGKGKVRMSKSEYDCTYDNHKPRRGAEVVEIDDDDLRELIEEYEVDFKDLKETRRGRLLPEQLYEHLTLNDNLMEVITATYLRSQVIEKVNEAIGIRITILEISIGDCEYDIIQDEEIAITYDNGRKGTVKKKDLMECDKCKKKTLRGKEMFEGGGVVCIAEDCDYWFCY